MSTKTFPLHKLALICLLTFSSVVIFAQSQPSILYSYDDAGNRTGYLKIKSLGEVSLDENSFSLEDEVEEVSSMEKGISIYPNPTDGQVVVNFGSIEIDLNKSELLLYSEDGRQIISRNIRDEISTIDIKNQSSGIYLVQVVNGDKKYSWQLIKK